MKRVSGKRKQDKSEKEVFLITASDEREFDVYKSLLESCGIPVLKKHREAGEYLNISMGMSVYGVDIYVPEKYHREALGLVKSTAGKEDEYDKEFEKEKESYQNRRLTYVWIIIAVFYSPFLVWLIYTLINDVFMIGSQ